MANYQGERFHRFLKAKDISISEAAKALNVSRQTVYQYFRSNNLSRETVNNILTVFNTTEEEVFGLAAAHFQDTQAPYRSPRLEAIPLRLADPHGFEATGQKFYTLPDGSDVMQIPVVPVKAWGSYPRGHADPEFYDGFETITIPVNKLHKGTYLAFEMKGRSMVNIETEEMARKSLWPGQKVIGRDLKREQWQYKLHIHSNEAWIIVHRTDGIMVKEIIDHDLETGLLKLHSWNPDKQEYPDFSIHIDDVEQLFNVVDPFGKMRPY